MCRLRNLSKPCISMQSGWLEFRTTLVFNGIDQGNHIKELSFSICQKKLLSTQLPMKRE